MKPDELLQWASNSFKDELIFITALQKEGCILIHEICKNNIPIKICTIDTGLLFTETYQFKAEIEKKYRIKIETINPKQKVHEQAKEHGPSLWARDPDKCCSLRKVESFRETMKNYDAYITSIRREQTPERKYAEQIELVNGKTKINPLVDWTAEMVEEYIKKNDIKLNSLYETGYKSIGCWPCTTKVQDGEDDRAGRWRGSCKNECGIHSAVKVCK